MLDGRPGVVLSQTPAIEIRPEPVDQKAIVELGSSSNAMNRFLKLDIRSPPVPDCGSTCFAAFTDNHVTFAETEAFQFVVFEGHCS
jgi:hypothetical protein